MFVLTLPVGEERQSPLIADDEAVARVEHGTAVFCDQIKGILGEIILAGCALGGRAGDVEGSETSSSVLEKV